MNFLKTIFFHLMFSVLFSYNLSGQTYAPQIITNDCSGVSHNLREKLSQGKIIVIGWAMPCAPCAAPLLSVHNAVLNFAISNPGKVEYWLADDYANTTCQSLEGWCKSNGINNATYFSSSAIKMSDFGSDGMPKVVVIGCGNGKVFYNVNNTPDGTGVTNAINTALSELNSGCASATNIPELKSEVETLKLKIFPNPAKNHITVILPPVDFESDAKVTIMNAIGQVVFQKKLNELNMIDGQIELNISDLSKSIYYLKVEHNSAVLIQRFIKTNGV
jgi:hypothetical protein